MDIIFEDKNIICLNKKAGTPSQPDLTGDVSIFEEVGTYLKSKPYILNRIDRPVSGIILFAKNKKSAGLYSKSILNDENDKIYYAIVENKPHKQNDVLVNYLIKKNNKAHIVQNDTLGKKAILSYTHIGSGDRYHYLKISIKTGRFHQIRAQLSNIGCIIKGDVKYGARRSNKDRSICLHASQYKLINTITKEEELFSAPFIGTPLWDDLQSKIKDHK